ncbi:hypothetical protein BJ322DRAFT_1108599 [Thelephora terrestris]|uniref:DUF6532 domain-containing protein n=1 Tax=Thelephora terrestris TaxID=56493 RepID=A0A9P6HDR8_9AGAM|nr:hypothetical protein BJ322DRAFT_1108599 [Thelephora terrestris]
MTDTPPLQEPKFAESDSDDEFPAGKHHRAAAGDGKKPTITKENPLFNTIYKNAVLKLKHHIYFVDTFPTSAESDNLPHKVYNYGASFVAKSVLFHQDELQGVNKMFDKKWFSCLKTATLNKVNTPLTLYWYEISPTGEANLGRPFLNQVIIDVLKERYFEGRTSLYRLFPQEFSQSLTTEDGGKGPEIPPRLVALVATFIYYALTGNGKSSESWKYEMFNQTYEAHLAELKKIQVDNPECYHLILHRLFIKCIGDKAPVITQPTISENNYQGLDPANL